MTHTEMIERMERSRTVTTYPNGTKWYDHHESQGLVFEEILQALKAEQERLPNMLCGVALPNNQAQLRALHHQLGLYFNDPLIATTATHSS